MLKFWFAGVLALVTCFGPVSLAAQEGRTVLVLDASGSMWAKIGDRHRIQIARDVFSQLMDDLPPERDLAVVSYGHRRKSDCRDIQEIADFGTARDTMIKRVRKLNPRGKTPLAGAMEFAAEKLNYTKEQATVILVSDGRETCRRDPCVVAEKLKTEGFDFTAHVVGFDIDDPQAEAQLQCLASTTGGQYFSAANEDELSEALTGTFSAELGVAPGTPASLSLKALDLMTQNVASSGLNWSIRQARTGAEIVALTSSGPIALDLAPGLYDITVERSADGKSAELLKVRLRPGSKRDETLVFPVNFNASVTAVGGIETAVNANIDVTWEGPAYAGDYVAVAEIGTPDDAFLTRQIVDEAAPTTLKMPMQPGRFELRYVLGEPPMVLARSQITALDVIALVTAPEKTTARSAFPVDWRGPGYADDLVTVVPLDAPDTTIGNTAATTAGTPALVRAPSQPGLYEIRYLLAGTRVLARRVIEVEEGEEIIARLRAPASARAGGAFEIHWDGPNGAADLICILDPNDPTRTALTSVSVKAGSPVVINAPLVSGDFELHYMKDGGETLVFAPIQVSETTATITSPQQVEAQRTFRASITGPFFEGDTVSISDPTNPEAYTDTLVVYDSGAPLELIAPTRPGSYEIRYLLRGVRIIARQPLSVFAKG